MQREFQSADVARAAVRMALSETRADENELKEKLAAQGIRSVAVNFGGKFTDILPKIFESAIVAAQRQHVIEQVKLMAIGMNVGGKIGIARWKEHLCVAVFVGVGVLHFNEVTIGLAHRVLRNDLTD